MIDFRIFLSAVLLALPSDWQDPHQPNLEKLVAGAVGTSHAPVERDDRSSTALSRVFRRLENGRWKIRGPLVVK